ncbi:MAG: hypothetical protein DRO01_07795, partial [Thermoproteota archaeon]
TLLSWLAFVISLGYGAVMGIIPYYMLYLVGELRELPETLGTIGGAGSYAVEYGTLISAFMLTRAFLARYFGSLSDRVGRRSLIISGSIMYVLLSLGYLLANSLNQLYFIRGLQGVASAMVWPVAEALLMDSTGSERRGRAMAVYMVATNLAFITGPALGVTAYKFGVLYLGIRDVERALKFPFLFLTLFSLLGLPAAFLLREPRVEARDGAPGPREGGGRGELEVDPSVRRSINAIYLMAAANGIAMGFSGPLMSLFVVQYIDADPAALAAITTISGLVGMLAAYPSGRLSDAVGRKAIVIVGGLTSRVMTALIPLARSVRDLTALATARSVAFNSFQPVMRALQADLVPESMRGRVFGTVQAAFNVGAVIGPILGGYLYRFCQGREIRVLGAVLPGISVSFWIGSAIGLAALAVFALFVEERRGK